MYDCVLMEQSSENERNEFLFCITLTAMQIVLATIILFYVARHKTYHHRIA